MSNSVAAALSTSAIYNAAQNGDNDPIAITGQRGDFFSRSEYVDLPVNVTMSKALAQKSNYFISLPDSQNQRGKPCAAHKPTD